MRSLTCTHSFFVPRLVCAVVTIQPLVVVAGVGLVACLARLHGAGLAAVAAVCHEADAGGADWRAGRAHAGPPAVPRPLVWVHLGGCGRGYRTILGQDLRDKEAPSGCLSVFSRFHNSVVKDKAFICRFSAAHH